MVRVFLVFATFLLLLRYRTRNLEWDFRSGLLCLRLGLGLSSSVYDLSWGKRNWSLWLTLGKQRNTGTEGEPYFPGPSGLCQFKVYSRPRCNALGYQVLRARTSVTGKETWCLAGRRCREMEGRAMNETVLSITCSNPPPPPPPPRQRLLSNISQVSV